MVTRTFLDKSTTITRDDSYNYGLNPVCMLNYGAMVSRFLVHFNVDKVRELIEDGTYLHTDKLTHTLRMKNCGSINADKHTEKIPSTDVNGVKDRATSFTVLAFKVPQYWDEGVGFDSPNEYWIEGKGGLSQNGATWANATNEDTWPEEGIYSNDTMYAEYDRYKNGQESIIVAEQHFDHGNEDLKLDLTEYVKGLLDGDEDFGLCIAFVPELEDRVGKYTQYVGFFNNKTNTAFEPVLETRYNHAIIDNRHNFRAGVKNKLCLYTKIGEELVNLDHLPKCTVEIGNVTLEPTPVRESKGVYSIEIDLPLSEYRGARLLYDEWSDITYQGNDMGTIELDSEIHYGFDGSGLDPIKSITQQLNPICFGVDDMEELQKGERRNVYVYFQIPYKHAEYTLVKNAQYMIHLKDAKNIVSVVDWDDMNMVAKYNTFAIDTGGFVPGHYFVDIKMNVNNNIQIFPDRLQFIVCSNTTEERR